VESTAHYRELLASGVKYSQLDVRGGSSALLAADGTSGAPRRLHPVAAAMQARRAAGSVPGRREDGFKIALAVEGGGMRGCVAAGMVAAVHHLNLTDSLDVVYGSSAGSLIGAYLLSRQVRSGTPPPAARARTPPPLSESGAAAPLLFFPSLIGGSRTLGHLIFTSPPAADCSPPPPFRQEPAFGWSLYYEELPMAGRRFIDLRNVLRSLGLGALRLTPSGMRDLVQRRLGMPVLNLDQLLIEIVQKRKPLDFDRLWACQTTQPLRVVASALTSRRSVALGSAEGAWASLPALAHVMRASMLLPGICGPTVALNNSQGEAEPHADAMLYEPVPYRLAVREGATHVLVLRTRPDGSNVVRPLSFVERLIAHRFFHRKMRMPHMYRHMREQRHRRRYAEDLLLLNEASAKLLPNESVTIPWGVDEPAGPGCGVRMLQVALQPGGGRAPEVSNLQTDPGEIFHAVRCGFARAHEVLSPLAEGGVEGEGPRAAGLEAEGAVERGPAATASDVRTGVCGGVDGWAVAVQVFPDSILQQVQARIAAEAKGGKQSEGALPNEPPAEGGEAVGGEAEGVEAKDEPDSAWESEEEEADEADW
jgi:predicted acylesterase/phospholipase RssA